MGRIGLLVGLLVLSGVVWAEGEKFGSIAYSVETGVHGYGNGLSSREAARDRAVENCAVVSGSSCEEILWFRDACGALAVGARNGYGAAWDTDAAQAEKEALSNCAGYDRDCRVDRVVCTWEGVETTPRLATAPEPEVVRVPTSQPQGPPGSPAPVQPASPEAALEQLLARLAERLGPMLSQLDEDLVWFLIFGAIGLWVLRSFIRGLKSVMDAAGEASDRYSELRGTLVHQQAPKQSQSQARDRSAGDAKGRSAEALRLARRLAQAQSRAKAVTPRPPQPKPVQPKAPRPRKGQELSRVPRLNVVRDMNGTRRRILAGR